MPSHSRVYFAEVWKMVRRPMTWTLAIILAALIVLIYGVLIGTILMPEGMGIDAEWDSSDGTGLEDALLLPDGLFMGIGLVQLLVTALIIVLAAGMVGSELTWGTVRTMLMMGTGRIQLLAVKLLALMTAGIIWLTAGLLLAIGGSIVTGFVVGEGILAREWMNAAFLGDSIILIFRATIGVTIWATIAGTITLIARSIPAGLGVSLALLFVGGQIGGLLGQLGTFGTWIGRALPNAGVDAINALNSLSPPTYSMVDWAWIIANIAGWFVALAIAAIVTFRRMDTLAAGS